MSSNSEIISKTLKDYFGLEKSEVTKEQLKQVQKFIKSTSNAALIIERNKDSPNEVSFLTRDLTNENDHHQKAKRQKNDTIVFVKYSQNNNQKSDQSNNIINEQTLISNLRNQLHRCDGSGSSVMRSLSDLRQSMKYPNVLSSLNSERKDLLDKVISWSENVGEIYNSNDKDIIERIGIFKAREGKLKAVIRVCDQLFNDLEKYPKAKSTLEQVCKELAEQSGKLFREWHRSLDQVTLDSQKQCIEIDSKSQIPRVTFDPQLVKLAQDARILRCLGFALPQNIVLLEDQVRKHGLIARELREIVNFYCTVADQILLSQRPMLIDAAKAFTSLLESRDKISWDDDHAKLSSWIDQLKNFSKRFSTENRTLRKHHENVLNLIKPLFEMSISAWRTNINEVVNIMQEIDNRYENTLPWKKHWDYQLYKILEYHFNQALIKSNQLTGLKIHQQSALSIFSLTNTSNEHSETMKIDLCFLSDTVEFRPPIEEIKSLLYSRIQKFLSIPCQFQGFIQYSKQDQSLFQAIYLRNFNNFPILYEKADEMIDELEMIREKFIEWTSLYYLIKQQNLNEILSFESIEDYKSNLMLLKNKSQTFNKNFVHNEIQCESSNIFINIVPIKTFIDWLLIEVDKMLAKSLKDKCIEEMKIINDKCTQLLDQLVKRPQNISELINIDKLIRKEINDLGFEIKNQYSDLEAKLSFLMKWSAKIAPDINDVKNKYDEFTRIIDTKDYVLNSYKEILRAKTQAEIGNVNQEIELFIKQWNDNGEMIGSTNETKESITNIKLNCDDLALKCDELSQSCDYFQIDQPNSFSRFKPIVEQVNDANEKWNLMNEFESGMNDYLEMEWIVSRNKLNAIENYINKWQDDNPSAGLLLDNKMKEWRELLTLLKLCKGECFVKLHWQELIQMLSLSSIVNDYEHLKLVHLVNAKRQLIFMKDAIKELNTRYLILHFISFYFTTLHVISSTNSCFSFTSIQFFLISMILESINFKLTLTNIN